MSTESTIFIPNERAKQMWPDEIPACQIAEGGMIVDAKTVAFAAQEMMHQAYEQLETAKAERDQHFKALQFNREVLSKTAEILGIEDPFLESFAGHVQEFAKRYKWLRDQAFLNSSNCQDDYAEFARKMANCHGDKFDALIDAEMAKEEAQ